MTLTLYTWVILSVVVWLTSTTIARSRAFRPLRAWVRSRSDYFGEGVSCQYCLSHWVGLVVAALFRPQILPVSSGRPLVDFLATAFALVGLAALIARTIGKTPPDGTPHPDEVA